MLNRKATELDLCDVTPTASPPRCHPASPAPGGPARGHQGGRRGQWWEQGASSQRVMLGSDGSWMHVEVPDVPCWMEGRLSLSSGQAPGHVPALRCHIPTAPWLITCRHLGKSPAQDTQIHGWNEFVGSLKRAGLFGYANPALALKSCPAAFGAGSAPALSPAQIPYPPPGASHLRQHPGGKAAVCLDGKNKS